MTAFLISQNHNIKIVEVFTKQAFSLIMHRFFDQYLKVEDVKLVMKQWLSFRDQKFEFHQNFECWSYSTDSKLFWNFCKTFVLTLSCLARKIMMLPANSVLAERNWSIMNLIMNKTRNSLHSINVDKLMFIYMNERTLNRPKDVKSKLQFAGIDMDETDLCEMEDRLLQEEVSLTDTTTIITKRPASQTMMGDASRPWLNT